MTKRMWIMIVVLWLLTPGYSSASWVDVHDAITVSPSLSSPLGQRNPKVAFDGVDTYLVVWEQEAYLDSGKQIYASRIRVTNGVATSLDPSGIHLLETACSQAKPKVVYGGGVFFVIWQELSELASGTPTYFDVKGVRVNSSGNVLDPTGIAISSATYNQINPDVAYDSTNDRFFVVWADMRGNVNYQIYGARIDTSGTVLDASGILMYNLATTGWTTYMPIVQATSSKLLVAWSDIDNGDSFAMQAKFFSLSDGSFISDVYSTGSTNTSKIDSFLPTYTTFFGTPNSILTDGTDFMWLFQPVDRPHFGGPNAKFYLQGAYVKSDGTMPNNWQFNAVKNGFAPNFSGVYANPYYLLFWQGLPASYDNIYETIAVSDHNIYMTRMDKAGRHIYDFENPIIISASYTTRSSPVAELNPAAAKGSGTNVLVVYEEDNLLYSPIGTTSWIIKARLIDLSTDSLDDYVADTSAPGIFDGYPSGVIPSSTTSVELYVNTDETAACKYSSSPGTLFASMSSMAPGTLLEPVGRSFKKTISGITSSQTYNYYVKCQDTAGNTTSDENEYHISFSTIGSAGSLPSVSLAQDGSPTPEQISIFIPGVFPTTTVATMRYRVTGSYGWTTGHDLLRIRKDLVSNSYVSDGLAWTITDLSPWTSYDVQVKVRDGATDVVQSSTVVMTTKGLPAAAGVATKNITAGMTQAQMQTVLNSAVAGDVIQIANGTYNVNDLQITKSGTSTSPIYIRGESRDGAIIKNPTTGYTSEHFVIRTVNANYVVIENLTIAGSGVSTGTSAAVTGIAFYNGSPSPHDVTVRNITMRGTDQAIRPQGNCNNVLIYDNTLVGNFTWTQDLYSNTYPNGTPGVHSDGIPDVDQTIPWNAKGIKLTGNSNVAFNNTIYGFGDSFALESSNVSYNIHMYRNNVLMGGDDGVEFDYGIRNITFYDNKLRNTQSFVSFSPAQGGPFLVFRNTAVNVGRTPFKMNNPNTGHFVYNNTIVRGMYNINPSASPSYDWAWVQFNNGSQQAWGLQNNVVIYTGYAQRMLAMEPTGENPIDWSYNSWYPDGQVWWTGIGGNSDSLAEAKTQSYLLNKTPIFSGITSIHSNDLISELDPFANANVTFGYDYHTEITTDYNLVLSYDSVNRGSGVRITGITDNFSGSSPDRGARISGRSIPIYGDRMMSFTYDSTVRMMNNCVIFGGVFQ